jgi:hypothetical protein
MNIVDELLNKKRQAENQCISLLGELLLAINWDDGRKRVAAVIAEYWGKNWSVEDGDELIQKCLNAIEKVKQSHEALLRAVAEHTRQT